MDLASFLVLVAVVGLVFGLFLLFAKRREQLIERKKQEPGRRRGGCHTMVDEKDLPGHN